MNQDGPDSFDAPALGGALAHQARVDTLAGQPQAGWVDGLGPEARFHQPWGLALGLDGTLYVADSMNHCIRAVGPAGQVRTVAGSGLAGFQDGPASSAQFHLPRGLACLPDGSLLVADTANHRLRRIGLDGQVSTHSGEGIRGIYDGARGYARYHLPNGLAVDSQGWAYVADTDNRRIRKVSPGGSSSTLAGEGVTGFADARGSEARFSSPRAVAVGLGGEVYLVEVGNCRLRVVEPGGQVRTLAGDGRGLHADGPALEASFKEPCGLALGLEGSLIVADTDNHCIRSVGADGQVKTLAGSQAGEADWIDGPASEARFGTPVGLAVHPSGLIYVADALNHCIRRIWPA